STRSRRSTWASSPAGELPSRRRLHYYSRFLMAARRPASLAFTVPLVLAFGCGGAPPPTPTPGTADATERATPDPGKPATSTNNTPEAANLNEAPKADATLDQAAQPELTPSKKPSISCEPKAGTAPSRGPKLALSIDRAKVNLDAHKLEVKLTR